LPSVSCEPIAGGTGVAAQVAGVGSFNSAEARSAGCWTKKDLSCGRSPIVLAGDVRRLRDRMIVINVRLRTPMIFFHIIGNFYVRNVSLRLEFMITIIRKDSRDVLMLLSL